MNVDRASVVSARTNPFSTRFIRPGAVDYLFPPDVSAADLVRALAGHGWRGQIIGPHGSGKSTLLASLLEPLAQAGRPPIMLTFHQGESRLPNGWAARAVSEGARLVIVDGYEQLSAFSRLRLRWTCRRRGLGLLVTAHADTGFDTLFQTQPSLRIAQAVVAGLLCEDDVNVAPQDVAECFAACSGDVRETLFALYDRYEQRC